MHEYKDGQMQALTDDKRLRQGNEAKREVKVVER